MTRNKLTEALDAIDKGESPFNEPPLDTPNMSEILLGLAADEPPLDTPIEPSVAPKAHDGWNRTVFQDPQSFGAIPATDHDALEAQLTSEPAAETFAPVDKLSATVAERKTTHGNYVDHARITQSLKKVIALELNEREYRGQPPLTDRQRESIDMILHKIGRAVAGESGFADHWLDIQGYAKIAIDE